MGESKQIPTESFKVENKIIIYQTEDAHTEEKDVMVKVVVHLINKNN